jgi:hypothetical protein
MESDEIVTQFGMGRLPEPDTRDSNFLAKHRLAAAEPAPRKPYRYFKLAKKRLNQLATPRCVGFGSRNFLETAPNMYKKPEPSPETLYFGAQDNDEWPGRDYDGSSVRGAAKFLLQQGLIKGEYLWAFDVQTVLDWILTGQGPVLFGTNWYRSMFRPNAEGIITEISGPLDGGHCFLAYGANEKKQTISFINSWGADWGNNGTFIVPVPLVDRLIKEDGEALMSFQVG